MYFSPTGGTRQAAHILAEELGTPQEMDFSLPGKDYGMYRFEPGDVCFVAVPSFGGRVPTAALVNLTKVQAHGAAAVVVAAYGNRAYEDTLVEMQDIAEKQGFRVFAAVAAIAEHSIMHQYAAGRPDTKDTETLRNFSRTLWEKFNSSQEGSSPAVPGITSANKDRKAPGGGRSWTRAADDAAICA